MHAAYIVHPAFDHPGAVRGDSPKQRGYGYVLAVFGYQAFGIRGHRAIYLKLPAKRHTLVECHSRRRRNTFYFLG